MLVISIGAYDRIIQNPLFQNELSQLQQQFGWNISNDSTEVSGNAADAVSKVSPSVVSIFGTRNIPEGFVVMQQISAGTGFFVDPNGYIVTNKHVVSDTAASYVAVLSDNKRKKAEVLYRDPNNDLAILKIDGSGYPVLDLGDSSKLKVGQTVLGIGNAYGHNKKTVSQGEVAGLNRTIVTVSDATEDTSGGQRLRHVIQTTAQLYPGDSGGPLFDLSGVVVGVNVAISQEKDNESFSIPINEVKSVISQVLPNALSYR
jgi:serine protease Do